MNYDPTATYRSAQVTTSSPAAQVVLLYEGAIRFTAQSVQRLAQKDPEGSHNASLRAQAILSALRESLDMSAGPVAEQLDALYDFMLRRLVEGNLKKDPAAGMEVIGLLRDLLEAWRAIAAPEAAPARIATAAPAPMGRPTGFSLPIAGFPGGYAGVTRA